MKKLLLNLFFGLLAIAAFSQSPVYTLDFESAGGYTTTITELSDNSADYFIRSDGSNIGSWVEFTNMQGSWFFGAMDIDGDQPTLPVELNIDDIDITGITSLGFSIMMAEDDDGTNQDWDDADYVHIQYDIDNSGTFTDLIWISGIDGVETFNNEPSVDADFDGFGDGAIFVTSDFKSFTNAIAGTGTTIDIKIIFNLDSGDEDIAIDDIKILDLSGDVEPIGVVDPANNEIDVLITKLPTITFSEKIYKTDDGSTEIVDGDLSTLITFKVDDADGADVPATMTYNNTNFTITIDPTSDLLGSQDYYLAYNPVYGSTGSKNFGTNLTFTTEILIPSILEAYSLNDTVIELVHDRSVASVDPADYNLTGTAAITFTAAEIDGTDDKIVRIWEPSAAITGDATVDDIADANSNLALYAGVTPIEFTNANNAGGTIAEDIATTFTGIISANDAYNNVWIADAEGAFNGILIYDNNFDGVAAVGDEIIFRGILDIYNNLSEIKNPVLIEKLSTGNTPYGPSVIDGADISDAIAADTDPAEGWEGQLIKITGAKITVGLDGADYFYTATDDDGATTFRIGDNVDYHLTNITLAVDDMVTIIGVGDYDDGTYRINPRDASDVLSADATVSSTEYTVDNGLETITNVPYNTDLATFESNITAAASADFETYEADGSTVATDLATGYKVIVSAEDGITEKTYVITVNLPSSDATVSSTAYTVDNGLETITDIPFSVDLATFESNITPATGADFETYEGDGSTVAGDLATGYKVIVTAEDGTTEKIYTITIDAVSTDATLSDLQVSGTTVTDFASGTYAYEVELDAGTTVTPTVTAETTFAYANAVIDPATDVNGDTEAKRTTTITVTAEDGTTQDYTILFSVDPTGINELSTGFKIYPNPGTGLFKLEMNNISNGDYTVEVYDVIGKVVYKSNITESISNIDLTHMNSGLYYVSVNNGEERNITKIMIQ
ncbi:MAG: T9SS type A sorting domain-containing protein [Bacteroidales bacterium]|nr:T9SS type A sorting domain-containing protein [Bacteroidales bacterium]